MDIVKNKWVIGGIGAVVVLGLSYYLWSSAGSSALLTSSADGASPLSQEILTTLGQLHTIRLDASVFTDPVFVSLNDFSTTIPPQQAGRRNPFAPVGASFGTPSGASSAPAVLPAIPPKK